MKERSDEQMVWLDDLTNWLLQQAYVFLVIALLFVFVFFALRVAKRLFFKPASSKHMQTREKLEGASQPAFSENDRHLLNLIHDLADMIQATNR